jgi:hypothetical protein
VSDFLRAVDRQLQAVTEVMIIGGSAIGLAYEPRHVSPDIDLITSNRALFDLFTKTREQPGLGLPVQVVGVYFAPEGYEERRQQVPIEGLRHLHVYCPEKHDLAIMKLARGTEHDLQGIEEIHRASPLDLGTLVERFRETYVTGRPEDFRLSLLLLVERLFGKSAADELEKSL